MYVHVWVRPGSCVLSPGYHGKQQRSSWQENVVGPTHAVLKFVPRCTPGLISTGMSASAYRSYAASLLRGFACGAAIVHSFIGSLGPRAALSVLTF